MQLPSSLPSLPSARSWLVASLVPTLGLLAFEPPLHAQPLSPAPTTAAPEATPAAPEATPAAPEATPAAPEATPAAPAPSPFTLGGYVEAYYQWSFNDPSNGLSNFRGFDNRHDSFTLSNAALDAQWDDAGLIGRVTLQVGSTPSTYYLAEPALPGAAGASASSPDVWKLLQQAYAGYRFDVGRGLTLTAGLFLSPIGPESIAVRDNWTWSRSNLFFALPFYHAGVRAVTPVSDAWTLTLAATNGWNDLVDNNREKSASAQLVYTRPELVLSLLYFGGVERPAGAAEGRAWRHLFDAHATWQVTERLALLGHASAGVESNDLATSRWLAGALAARVQLCPTLFAAARADAFWEPDVGDDGAAPARIFWSATWVSSATATVDYRPHPRASFRLELRHDRAEDDLFFGGTVAGDGTAASPYVPNRAHQTTATLGATTWF